MLDKLPKESERLSWLYVVLWTLMIYSTIPFARPVAEWIAKNLGIQFFLHIAATAGVIGLILVFINLKGRSLPLRSYFWLTGVTVTIIATAYQLREVPADVIHLVEYVILSILVYRALLHRIHDYSIYFLATLMVAIIGTLEECIQWLVPSRVFDLRDIRTNFIAGGLAQLAIGAGLRPTLVSGSPSEPSLRRLCQVTGLAFLTLGLSFWV
ncbi:MAG: VanZ family protein [Arenicellales bacterium]|nr:VanZ family protein [Arenicellales bacterium]